MKTGNSDRKKVSFTCRLAADLKAEMNAFSERTGIDMTQLVEESVRGRMRETALGIAQRQLDAVLREPEAPYRVNSKPPAAPAVATVGQGIVKGALSSQPQTRATGESTAPASRPAKGGQTKKGVRP